MRFPMRFRLTLLSLISLALVVHALDAQQPPSRPKIFDIAVVQIVVSDIQSAHDFYSKALNKSQIQSPAKTATASGLPDVAAGAVTEAPVDIRFARVATVLALISTSNYAG